MATVNTKTLINYLPLDPKEKLELLESYDSLTPDEQNRITSLAWSALAQLEKIKLQENFEKGIENPGDIPLDENYYKAVAEKTEKEIDEGLATASQSVDLTNVRDSMEKIVKELNAVKNKNTP